MSPPPYSETPFSAANPAYVGGIYPTNTIVASGGQHDEPVKVPLTDVTNQISTNQKQYMEKIRKKEAEERFIEINRVVSFLIGFLLHCSWNIDVDEYNLNTVSLIWFDPKICGIFVMN